ncbi:hypothetical protein F6Q07_15450 [Pectobacterium parmentieri]|uniref:Uncharacterized protein n=1 Tax=Pectobacterium parmentieri TaxID=1905730 RepID=A0A8B3FAS6_PECPM|nr:hypothetical protein [Pectobacterium parmentieri]ACX87867.1 conserved hypothetical protein [Pectobacterium parmentieri WPP163]AOR58930.1 hypothetical protein A8F97_08415 [Pectobacterium parmentieri]AYH01323.1 hypothetical protein C5E26_10470 [Pectobacterium parmentieri]AYH05586.1 hypothetical protein C5E25_09635 [Pectobacterium parmentieri]AYH10037.1 hypothetical protein C5E24_10275 [Pectobacterium parmentieri]
MQLTYPKAPSNGVQALRPALQSALKPQGFGINRQFAAAKPGKIKLSEGYRGYSLNLEDLIHGKGLKDAKVGDWHYLVFADEVTIADAQLTDVHGHVEFASLNHGNLAAATVEALKLADLSPQLQGKTVELRVLFISALHVVAIWLYADSEDVLIPIEPTPKEIAVTQLYNEVELLALLKPAADQAHKRFDADTSGLLGGG